MVEDNSERILRDLRQRVRTGRPGERLPSVRDLVAAHRASPLTVQRVVTALAAEGLVEPRPGQGTFVAARPPAAEPPADLSWQSVALGPRPTGADDVRALLAQPPPGAIALSGGYPEAPLQPLALAAAALARASRRPASWDRGAPEGREDLRAWFARAVGGGLGAHDVIITPGAQPALATAFRALTTPGEPVVVESPTYVGALAAARAAHVELVAVPSDTEGLRPDLLDQALTQTGARLVYAQPLYANPHGGVLSPERRQEVHRLLARHHAFLVEDDWARDLSIDGDPPRPLASDDPEGHVVYVRSLTKCVAPGLRVAALAARGAAAVRLREARVVDDLFVSGPLQEAAVEIVSSPSWPRHLRQLRTELGRRRDALAAALARHLPQLGPAHLPRGGLHLWVRLPDGLDDVTLAAAAPAHGVVVYPGRPLHPAEAPGPFVRLTFAAAPLDALDEGVRRLAEAVRASV
jgi:DNA-binding transcriptional MocR family regulator